MAVCDLCKGTGRLLKPWYDTTGLMTGFTGDICFKCNGKGTIGEPMTNEEWFAGLSTKEKAKWMFELTYKCYWCGREYAKTKKYNEKECPFHKCLDDSKGFEEWLKEPHTPIS